ncbi:MAG: thioredoxin family protein [Bacteroidetes bacterium]|nr:thioredoxin family protein [Bacteroidota bacterium]
MIKIEIIDTGCPICSGLEDNVREALKKTGKKAKIILVNKFDEIIEKGILSTPAIIIDDEIKSSGQIISVEQIKELLNEMQS